MHERDLSARRPEPERHPERVEHEIVAHVAGQLPADNHA